MIVIPAVDLREGACVQLVGGAIERLLRSPERATEKCTTWLYSTAPAAWCARKRRPPRCSTRSRTMPQA